jgi:hypothetical protein
MVAQTQVVLPAELVKLLSRDAEAMKLSLPAYLSFLRECNTRQLDAKFRDAAKFMFSKYPDTLRKLSQ